MLYKIPTPISEKVWASATFFSKISVPAIAINKPETIKENTYIPIWSHPIGFIISSPNNGSNGVQNLKNNPTNNTPVKSSTNGYCQLICSWQNAHFPLKNKYENNGILWYHFSGVWHFGHFEAGNTIDSSLTVLKITTFKKLLFYK